MSSLSHSEIFHFASCTRCDWTGPIRDTQLQADSDAIAHEADHATDDQAQIDIGDDIYEQERYSEHAIDIVPDEQYPWSRKQDPR
jgi:hypothetical protein